MRAPATHAKLEPLPWGAVRVKGGFWGARRRVNREITIPHCYEQLAARGAIDLFRTAAAGSGDTRGNPTFSDSDVFKWLEAEAWSRPDAGADESARRADELTELVALAQRRDGYLNTVIQLHPDLEPWADLAHSHEMYNAGHLIEAAVARHRALGDERLLQVACRFADHICELFGPGRREETDGHPEIELALIELHRVTGEPAYLDCARLLLERSRDQLADVLGHAVRRLYLLSGAADLHLVQGDPDLLDTLTRTWRRLVESKLYVTGGAGARHEGEAFGEPYELPSDTAYAETCAAIAALMLHWRMQLATGDHEAGHQVERVLYNGLLSGGSLSGDRFFYVNPLETGGDHERQAWFPCSCCPPNLARLVASVERYAVTTSPAALHLQQYIDSVIDADLEGAGHAGLRVETAYPFEGRVRIEVEAAPHGDFTLAARLPAWCRRPGASLAGRPLDVPEPAAAGGYLTLRRAWRSGDVLELDFPMEPELIHGHPAVAATRGRVAVRRGPLVHCFEQPDVDCDLDALRIAPDARLEETWRDGLPIVEVRPGAAALPYFAWNNRGAHAMRVWVPVA